MALDKIYPETKDQDTVRYHMLHPASPVIVLDKDGALMVLDGVHRIVAAYITNSPIHVDIYKPQGAQGGDESGPLMPKHPMIYAVISGDVDVKDRTIIQDIASSNDNMHGGVIDLILISSTGAEGLDLKNIRHVHILEPYWNYSRIMQVISRAVRSGSHVALPPGEKNVQPYVYLAVPPESERSAGVLPATTDTELYDEAILDQIIIDDFVTATREVSIECMLNGEANCRVCSPTSAPLFTNEILNDVRMPDPCTRVTEEQVVANEIIVEGKKYYYVEDSASIFDYRVYVLDDNVNGYIALREDDPLFETIIAAINAAASNAAIK
jgi:hypothetical protein